MSALLHESNLADALARKGVEVLLTDSTERAKRLVGAPGNRTVVGIEFKLPAQALELAAIFSSDDWTVAATEQTESGCVIYALDPSFRNLSLDVAGRLQATLDARNPAKRGKVASLDGHVSTDLLRQALVIDGRSVALSCAEWEILCCLAESPFRIWSREELLAATPRDVSASLPDRRTIDAHVKNLRRKLETDPHHASYLLTARSRGYYLQGFRKS